MPGSRANCSSYLGLEGMEEQGSPIAATPVTIVAVALEAASRLQLPNSPGKLPVPQGTGELITLFCKVLTPPGK